MAKRTIHTTLLPPSRNGRSLCGGMAKALLSAAFAFLCATAGAEGTDSPADTKTPPTDTKTPPGQTNPYKISDLLYKEYLEAFNYRTSPEGVRRARALYRHAEQLGDRKAQCMALTIPVIYYTMLHTDDAAFERAVKELQDAAVKFGYEQYYYYGVTNRVNYLVNLKRTSDAFAYVSDVEREARRRKSAYGAFTALNALGQLHAISSVYGQSIDCYKKALDYGHNYLRDQDMAPQYRKIAECYEYLCDYTEMLRYAEKGYAVSRTSTTRIRSIRSVCYASFMLGDYDRFQRYYNIYTQLERKPDPTSVSLHEREIAILKLIHDADYDTAWHYIETLPNGYDIHKMTMKAEIMRLRHDYRYMAELLNTLYWNRIRGADMVKEHTYNSLSSLAFNQLLAFENQRLALERQTLANEQQRTQIRNTQLELDNTQLLLHNSSLELRHTRTEADLKQQAYNRKRLEAERLRKQVEAQKAETELHHTLLLTLIAIGSILAIAVAAYLYSHRKMMRRLSEANRELERKNRELTEERNKAEAASRAKTAFIQNMDEQIRQPLYSAVSCARTIANSIHSYAPKVQLGEYNSTLQKSTDDILRLVADVLDKAQGGT